MAIIDLANNRAIGPNPGTIEYTSKVNGVTHTDSYQVVSSIQKDWPIAPIGNSNAVYGTHLHLYLVKNAFADPQGINNAKNPLQTIIHQNTNFDISIDGLNNLTEFGSGNFFQGNLRSSVNIKINMPDANQGVSYSNSILDIDSTVLLIKMFGEDDSKYEMIKGDEYYSKIVLGGRLDHKRYPSLGWPISNVYDISKIAGNPKNTGIEPHAYSTTSPFDNYFFLISSREFTKKIYSMD